jgi:hypothetical protein
MLQGVQQFGFKKTCAACVAHERHPDHVSEKDVFVLQLLVLQVISQHDPWPDSCSASSDSALCRLR